MANPTLEGLPTELLILILLEIPDLTSLKSIVISSPIFHQAYLAVRQEALCRIVKDQWGILLGDAVAATRSRGLLFAGQKREAIALLDTWRRKEEISKLGMTSSNRIDEPGSMEEIGHLFYLHKVFNFFLEDYAKNLPRPYAKNIRLPPWLEEANIPWEIQWETSVLPIKLSHTEKHRLLRALCRLQIYANIFGQPECHRGGDWFRNDWNTKKETDSSKPASEEAWRVFFGTIPPWEYHEMACVWAYFTTMFDPIYKEVTAGLYELVEKHMRKDDSMYQFFDSLPEDVRPPSGGMESLQSLQNLPDRSKSLASMGPEFVYRLLHGTPLIRRDMVKLNAEDDILSSFPPSWLWEEDKLPFLYPADRHAVQNYEGLWSTLPSFEKPNLGWRMMHLLPHTPEQTFEDAIDLEGGDEALWSWGFAIFDDERLTAWKAPLLEYRLAQFPHIPV
ncbi:Lysosome-associated membrane glycoprotein, conserved site [Penicillium camemberti]|uniref:Lysosome-associated membrane glycoprotein, conserved site n=1 Tax=Penicillium camemberti (strain FM 013) TaxID=1429867 RepID=A0A0G4PJY1_PENC3|nr:Lysosome-associated membrane glycoprotein, conserved site [Penicillium camemberti]